MTLFGVVARCFKNYANFRMRAARPAFWWFFVFYVATIIALVWIEWIVFGDDSTLLTTAGWLLMVIANLAVTTPRLYDTGRSGWLQLISFVPLVGPILLIIWVASPGPPSPNQWGPPPR